MSVFDRRGGGRKGAVGMDGLRLSLGKELGTGYEESGVKLSTRYPPRRS